jgi:hypothetical protein
MPADVLAFADEIAALLQGEFDAAGADAAVSREYEITFDVGTFTGLKVVVMPVEYAKPMQADRAEDYYEAAAVVVVAERYTGGAARPPADWLDERVNLVERCVFDPLRRIGANADDPRLLLDAYWCESAEVTTVYDAPFLREQQAFWSETELTFRKLRDAAS